MNINITLITFSVLLKNEMKVITALCIQFYDNKPSFLFHRTQSYENKWTIRYVYNAILSLESIVLCLVTYFNRYHLFIWTVFAPKFLFLVSFRLFMTIIILIF